MAPNPRPDLLGRASEREVLDRLLANVRDGRSGVLVLRGEAGIGKTALLEHLAESASELTVLRAVGVESEMELAFAGLHQLCGPMLDRLDQLPLPQQDALAGVWGWGGGGEPGRLMVGLSVLRLLSEVAADEPLVCLVDEADSLDRESAQAL